MSCFIDASIFSAHPKPPLSATAYKRARSYSPPPPPPFLNSAKYEKNQINVLDSCYWLKIKMVKICIQFSIWYLWDFSFKTFCQQFGNTFKEYSSLIIYCVWDGRIIRHLKMFKYHCPKKLLVFVSFSIFDCCLFTICCSNTPSCI